jgi:hypothetical protein
MSLIKRQAEGYLIDKNGSIFNVEKRSFEHFPAESIFIILGVFTVFEYSELIDKSCEIFVFEAEDEFKQYLPQIVLEAGFTNLKLIESEPGAFVNEFLTSDMAARTRILRNREIYAFSREMYSAWLGIINNTLSEIKKNGWIIGAQKLKKEMEKAIGEEKEVLALMSYVLDPD